MVQITVGSDLGSSMARELPPELADTVYDYRTVELQNYRTVGLLPSLMMCGGERLEQFKRHSGPLRRGDSTSRSFP
jgi:hypothetical protein